MTIVRLNAHNFIVLGHTRSSMCYFASGQLNECLIRFSHHHSERESGRKFSDKYSVAVSDERIFILFPAE